MSAAGRVAAGVACLALGACQCGVRPPTPGTYVGTARVVPTDPNGLGSIDGRGLIDGLTSCGPIDTLGQDAGIDIEVAQKTTTVFSLSMPYRGPGADDAGVVAFDFGQGLSGELVNLLTAGTTIQVDVPRTAPKVTALFEGTVDGDEGALTAWRAVVDPASRCGDQVRITWPAP